jgi:sulfite reductase (ferredoxin)
MSDESNSTASTPSSDELVNDALKLSAVELIKDASRYLRGTIGSELLTDSTHFGKDDLQLLKFHGTYQQDDREQRKAGGDSGKSEKEYSFMVRSRIPAGIMTAEQLLTHLDLSWAGLSPK